MSTPLRVLIVEDSEDDTILAVRELQGSGYDPTFVRVETADAFSTALQQQDWDAIICDYALPQFSAPEALSLLQESALDLPFVIVSGVIGEETAVAAMKAGAHDYIMKDNLSRLVPAIERELREAEVRRQHRQAQAALRESEQRYQVLVETMGDGLISVDRSGALVYVNDAFCRMLGYPRNELVGKPLVKLCDDANKAILQAQLAELLNKGRQVEYELYYTAQSGRQMPVLSTAMSLCDAEGEITGSFAVIKDITERKEAQRRSAHLNSLLRAISCIHQLILKQPDPQGLLRGACECILRTRDYLWAWMMLREEQGGVVAAYQSGVGESFAAFCEACEQEPLPYCLQTALRDPQTQVIEEVAAACGDCPLVSITPASTRIVTPLVHEGRFYGLLAVATTDGMASAEEQALLSDVAGDIAFALRTIEMDKKRQQAETRLRETTAELARSNVELEEFAYIASHDLKEPLRIVATATQLLARQYQDQLDEDADELITAAVDGAKRMERLISDLLAYSQAGRADKDLEEVDCGLVVDEVCRSLAATIDEAGAQVTRDELPTVTANAAQMNQLFQNLIGNAIKFRADTPLRVHISATRKDDYWVFAVADNGMGIDPEYQDRIFTLFQRLDKQAGESGTGAGLAICKKIVERYGGEIWVESAPGEGATFYFALPIMQQTND